MTNVSYTSTPADAGAARMSWAVLGAGALHTLVFVAALYAPPPSAPPVVIVSEVELAPPPPAPEPAREPEPTPEPAAAPRPVVRARVARAAPEPPPPAAAGNLITADAPPAPDAEPVRFAVDAHGAGYGYGVVARGGVGTGVGGAGNREAPPAAPAASAPQPVTHFAEPPRLDELDPCRGFFPESADADSGDVVVMLVVATSGAVQRADIVKETPVNQGFGKAALACLKRKRFTAARGHDGAPVTARAPVALNFRR